MKAIDVVAAKVLHSRVLQPVQFEKWPQHNLCAWIGPSYEFLCASTSFRGLLHRERSRGGKNPAEIQPRFLLGWCTCKSRKQDQVPNDK